MRLTTISFFFDISFSLFQVLRLHMEDGSKTETGPVPVSSLPVDTSMARRGWPSSLGLGIVASAAAVTGVLVTAYLRRS